MSRVAVIGAGISGMSAAYLLSAGHEVWLFEREPRLGGHTHTHEIETGSGSLAIDTGFIVHNDRTYPNLVRLFQKLGVQREPSDMSFGVTCSATGFEYSSRGLAGFFGGRNIVNFRQYRLFKEILRFNREARAFLRGPRDLNVTLGAYLREHRFDGDLSRLYLYPMAAAVWSTSLDQIEEFPAFSLINFFENHGFLGLTTQAQWYVLKGGSHSYIAPLTQPYRDRIRLSAQVRAVRRQPHAVTLMFDDGTIQQFDEVVFACHAPQALELLSDATFEERSVLRNFTTSRNEVVLHTDTGILPKRKSARASWNYNLGTSRDQVTVTYHMNRLQNLPTDGTDYCVTLNDDGRVRESAVLRRTTYWHPLYTIDAVRAQSRWREISGVNRTHFCGAYWSNGFHEDGLNSALRVAESFNREWKQAAA